MPRSRWVWDPELAAAPSRGRIRPPMFWCWGQDVERGQRRTAPFLQELVVLHSRQSPQGMLSPAGVGSASEPSTITIHISAQSLLQKTINSSTAALIRQDKPVSF